MQDCTGNSIEECREPLRAGDIILSLGLEPHSEEIRAITGGCYSHATLWNGERLVEATMPEVRELDPAELAAKSRYVDAFRHVGAAGREELIVEGAQRLIDRGYDTADLVLAIAMGTFSAWVQELSPSVALNSQYLLNRMRGLVTQLHDLFAAYRPATVTCVELVVRAHQVAGLPIHVKLDPGGRVEFSRLWPAIQSLIAYRDQHEGKVWRGPYEADFGTAALEQLAQEVAWATDPKLNPLDWLRPADARLELSDLEASLAFLQELELVAATRWDKDTWNAGLVTPKQLAQSRDLRRLGRLSTGVWAQRASATHHAKLRGAL